MGLKHTHTHTDLALLVHVSLCSHECSCLTALSATHLLKESPLSATVALIVPPPRPLTGGKAASAAVMSAAMSAVEVTLDEVRHMRRYSRFGAVPEGPTRPSEEEDDVPGPADGEGNRLLMGQWQYKAEVRYRGFLCTARLLQSVLMELRSGSEPKCILSPPLPSPHCLRNPGRRRRDISRLRQVSRLVSHQLTAMAEKAVAEQQLDSAVAEHAAVSSRLAGVMVALQAKCAAQRERLGAMVAAGREEEAIQKVCMKQRMDLTSLSPCNLNLGILTSFL